MARTEKKIQFQLSWGGLTAVTVSTVCVLLWAFVLGFWSGKKMAEHNTALYVQHAAQQPQRQEEANTAPPAAGAPPMAPPAGAPSAAAPLNKPTETVRNAAQGQQPPGEAVSAGKEAAIAPETKRGRENAAVSSPAAGGAVGAQGKPEKAEEAAASNGSSTKTPSAKPESEAEKTAPTEAGQKPSVTKNASKPVHPTPERNATAEKTAARKTAKTKAAGSAAKPASAAKAKAEKEATGAYYALQTGAYKEKKHAEIERVRLEARGYKAQIRGTDIGSPTKGVLYRVYLGRFKTPEEAKAFAKTLRKKEGIESYVVMIKE